jgi:hypothetical protein
VLSILGAGSAYASGDFPSGSFGQGAPKAVGGNPRGCFPKTVLPEGYLESTKNADPREAPKVALESPTDLAFKAASQALARAGITAEQVGLILGDTATPREKTPSEAQRLGKRFGLKIPAFDVTVGAAAFVQHLDIINSWREDRVPEYVLLVSSNCPSENLDWSKGGASQSKVCDAAAALVVSAKHPGKLVVKETYCSAPQRVSNALSIDTFGYLSIDVPARDEAFAGRLDELVTKAVKSGFARPGEFRLLCSSAHPGALAKLSELYLIAPEDRWYEQILDQGDSFGSSVGRVIADRWDEVGEGRKVVVAVAGSGSTSGFAILE